MLLLLLVLYVVLILFGIKFTFKGSADYLSVPNTQAIKGIFILMVFFSHFNSYITLSGNWDQLYQKFFFFIGQAMVAPFLFYSGYGVMESIKRKGTVYVAGIPKKRVLGTLFNFDCAVVLYLILGLLLGSNFTAKQILLSLIGWDSLGNSNWYIFVILVLYVLTYLAFAIFPKKSPYLSVTILGVIVCALIYITRRYHIRDVYWYDTMLCYILGMGYSLVKQYVEKILNKNGIIWLASLLLSVGLYVALKGRGIWDLAANLMFTIALVILTMRVTLHNKVLQWCGEHLFELYILQRIPMIVLDKLGLLEFNACLGFVVCVIVAVLLSIGFGFVTNLAWKKLTERKITSI